MWQKRGLHCEYGSAKVVLCSTSTLHTLEHFTLPRTASLRLSGFAFRIQPISFRIALGPMPAGTIANNKKLRSETTVGPQSDGDPPNNRRTSWGQRTSEEARWIRNSQASQKNAVRTEMLRCCSTETHRGLGWKPMPGSQSVVGELQLASTQRNYLHPAGKAASDGLKGGWNPAAGVRTRAPVCPPAVRLVSILITQQHVTSCRADAYIA